MKRARIKNKVLQAIYKPGKSNVAGTVINAFSEIDKTLDKSLGKLGGKKPKKKEDKKEDKEKKNNEKTDSKDE